MLGPLNSKGVAPLRKHLLVPVFSSFSLCMSLRRLSSSEICLPATRTAWQWCIVYTVYARTALPLSTLHQRKGQKDIDREIQRAAWCAVYRVCYVRVHDRTALPLSAASEERTKNETGVDDGEMQGAASWAVYPLRDLDTESHSLKVRARSSRLPPGRQLPPPALYWAGTCAPLRHCDSASATRKYAHPGSPIRTHARTDTHTHLGPVQAPAPRRLIGFRHRRVDAAASAAPGRRRTECAACTVMMCMYGDDVPWLGHGAVSRRHVQLRRLTPSRTRREH